MFRKFPRKLLSYLLVFVLLTPYFVGPAPLLVEAVNAETVTLDPFPSTNEYNKNNGQPYVELVSKTLDSIKIKFVNPRVQAVWFENKTDSQSPTANKYGPCRVGAVPLSSGCDGKRYLAEDDYSYSSVQVAGGSTIEKNYPNVLNSVSIRMTFGPERDWDFDWITFNVANTSSTYFVNDPKYVRAGNGVDLVAQIVTPDETTDVRFYVDGGATPIPGQNIGGAGSTTSWWRLYTPLPAGEHTISVEILVDGVWLPVSDTGVVYSLDLPWAEYVQPSGDAIYRTTDNPVRLRVEDQYEQFRRMVVTIDGTGYEVLREKCDLRQAGNYLLCDVKSSPSWTGLTEGAYTAKTTTYTKANNRVDNLVSQSFTIDGTVPQVSDFTSPEITSKAFEVSVKASDANGIDRVRFYVAEKDHLGECKNNLPGIAEVMGNHVGGDVYVADFPITGLQGDYCVLVSARDKAMHNSVPLFRSIHIDSTAPSLIVLDAESKKLLTKTDPIFAKTTDVNGIRTIHANIYKVGEDGRSINPAVAQFPFNFNRNDIKQEVIHEIKLIGLEDGKYELRLASIDTLLNRTENLRHYFTIDSTAPEGIIVYSGGVLSDGVRYIKSINDLSFTGTFTDNNDLERTTYAVWKVDSEFKNRTLFCGNWNTGASTYMPLSGMSDSVNAKVKDCAPSATWADGYYEIGHRVYDLVGHHTGLNRPTEKFVIDSTAPTMSNINMFVNGEESELTKSGDTIRITAEVTDEYSDLDKVQIWVREYPWDPNNNELISGQMSFVSGDLWEFTFVVPTTYKDGDALNEYFEGNYFNFRPYDVLGNSHIGWRENFTIDNTAPNPPTELHRVLGNGDVVSCGAWIPRQALTPTWTKSISGDVDYYEYSSFNLNGVPGLKSKNIGDTDKFLTGGWIANDDGSGYKFALRAVDHAGNKSDWVDCGVNYDTVRPEVSIDDYEISGDTLKVEVSGTDDRSGLLALGINIYNENNTGSTLISGLGRVADNLAQGILSYSVIKDGIDISSLAPGTYTIRAVSLDHAGNYSFQKTLQFTIEEDSTPTPTPTDEPTPTPTQVLPTVTNTPTDTAAPTPTSDILPQSGQSTSQTSSTGSVLSAANSNSSNNNNTSRLVRNFALTASTGNTDNNDENSDEDTENANVLGEEVCKEDKKISGKVFLDKNKTGEFDEGDEALDDIDLRIYTHNADDERVLVKTVTTDSEGDWELDVCIGSYEVEISESSIPDGMKVEQTVQEVEIEEGDEEQGVVFAIFRENGVSEQSFWEKYQWWIIGLIVLILLAGGGMYLTKRSEIQN